MKTLIILTLFLATCSARLPQTAAPHPSPTNSPVVAQNSWEPIFFKEIDQRVRVANLADLRSSSLPSGDSEVRVWVGFGLSPLVGFVIKRSSGEWSGVYLTGIHSGLPKNKYELHLPPPKSGWDSLWQQLTSHGILSLPDAHAIQCTGGALDGVCYVVETNVDKTYRTFMYDNPQYARCEQAKQMVEISRILFTEFRL
jgi:hypothetical protein